MKNLNRLIALLLIPALLAEPCAAVGLISSPNDPHSSVGLFTAQVIPPQLLWIRNPQQLPRKFPKITRLLSPRKHIAQYLRRGLVVEVRLDKRGNPTAFQVAPSGRRTDHKVNLHTFLSLEDFADLRTKLQFLLPQKKHGVIRILLGGTHVLFNTRKIIYIGEMWVHHPYLANYYFEMGMRRFKKVQDLTSLISHSESAEMNQERLNRGRRTTLPTFEDSQVDKAIRDPGVKEGRRYLIADTVSYELGNLQSLPNRQPKVARALDISKRTFRKNLLYGQYRFQYLNTPSLIARLKRWRNLYGTFWSASGDRQADLDTVAEQWDKFGAAPIQANGKLHEHDWDIHVLGFIALFTLKEVMALSRAQVRIIRRLLRDPAFQKSDRVHQFLEMQRNSILLTLDSTTAELNFWIYLKSPKPAVVRGSIRTVQKELKKLTSYGRTPVQLVEMMAQRARWPARLRRHAQEIAQQMPKMRRLQSSDFAIFSQQVVHDISTGFIRHLPETSA